MKSAAFALCLLVPILFLASCAEPDQKASATPMASAASAPAMSDADIEKALLKIEEDGAKAMIGNDTAFVEKYFVDSWAWTMANGQSSTKAELLADIKSGKIKFTVATPSDLKVHVYGNSAIVTGTMTTKGTYDKHDISGTERFTDSFANVNGQWKMVASHNSPAPKSK